MTPVELLHRSPVLLTAVVASDGSTIILAETHGARSTHASGPSISVALRQLADRAHAGLREDAERDLAAARARLDAAERALAVLAAPSAVQRASGEPSRVDVPHASP